MKLLLSGLAILVHMTMLSQQNDVFNELDDLTIKESSDVIATFKSTRLMLGQSTERVQKNQLHFRISHVFGKIKGIVTMSITLYGTEEKKLKYVPKLATGEWFEHIV